MGKTVSKINPERKHSWSDPDFLDPDFRQAALQRYLEAGVRAERGKHTAGARVHQGDAHHWKLAAQRRVLQQHRKALFCRACSPARSRSRPPESCPCRCQFLPKRIYSLFANSE